MGYKHVHKLTFREYLRVKSQGEQAVNAIDTYTEVAANLDEAIKMATAANKTISEATVTLEGITKDALMADAEASRVASQEQGNKVAQMLTKPSGK